MADIGDNNNPLVASGLTLADIGITNTDSPYTVPANKTVIRADATSGAITINLPTAVGIAGRTYKIYRTDIIASTNIITIDPNSTETIDSNSTYKLYPAEWLHIESDGANWVVIARPTVTPSGYYFAKDSTKNRRYLAGICTNATTITSTTGPLVNRLYAMPFYVGKTTKFDLICCEITTAGAGSNCRLGVYYDDGNCYPGALIFDSGNISSATTGEKSATITSSLQVFQPGLYWLTYENSATVPQVRALGSGVSAIPILGWASPFLANLPGNSYDVAHTVGALPNPYTAGAAIRTTASSVGAPIPAVGLRAI
jgi:hypothetical protein